MQRKAAAKIFEGFKLAAKCKVSEVVVKTFDEIMQQCIGNGPHSRCWGRKEERKNAGRVNTTSMDN